MFKIRMLPADYGDSLWVEYGSESKPTRILIDAGTLDAYDGVRRSIEESLPRKRRFDVFLVSHIDTDHIDSAVKLLNSDSLRLEIGQLWFNGWKQLVDKDVLGPQQGEYLSALAGEKKIPINKAWKGKTIFVPDSGSLPKIELPGGMSVTLLAPGIPQLRKLRTVWKRTMKSAAGHAPAALKKLQASRKYSDVLGGRMPNVAKLADSPFEPDAAVPNGSSIVVLLEYENKRALFAADTHPDLLEAAVDRLLAAEDAPRLRLDAFKVPHHGSKHNNPSTLYSKLNCRRYLISTNGKKFSHPHPEGIARIIKYGGSGLRLYFNYDSDQTRIWNVSELKRRYRYSVSMREKDARSLDIDL
jgi:beta-lactamase superfamily II metal-dependent hydrolase